MIPVCCSVLQCVAVCCSVLLCAFEDTSALQRAAVCCSVLQCVAMLFLRILVCCSVLQGIVCVRGNQCVAVCRSVLQYEFGVCVAEG